MTTAVTQGPAPTREQPVLAQHSNAYDLFILVLTILSLGVMVGVLLPLNEETLIGPPVLRQPHLRHLPHRFHRQHHPGQAQARVLDRSSRLAGPHRLDPHPGHLPHRRAAASGPPQPAGARQPDAQGQRPSGAHRRRHQEPGPVRHLHHPAHDGDRAHGVERARPPVRVQGPRTPTSSRAAMRCGGPS